MATLEFRATRKETVLLDPREDLRPKTIPSEIRVDPLTGRTARICHFMALRWEKPDFEKLVAGTEAWCPFCPDKVRKVTPRFPGDLLPEGRLESEDRILFPNLAPYDGISAVATLGARHFFPMTAFTPERVAGAFSLAQQFFRRLHEVGHPESLYHLINWNHMPPAGSSLIHSHIQVFASSHAPNLMRQELEAARAYRQGHRANYWDDLVRIEQERGSATWAGSGEPPGWSPTHPWGWPATWWGWWRARGRPWTWKSKTCSTWPRGSPEPCAPTTRWESTAST